VSFHPHRESCEWPYSVEWMKGMVNCPVPILSIQKAFVSCKYVTPVLDEVDLQKRY